MLLEWELMARAVPWRIERNFNSSKERERDFMVPDWLARVHRKDILFGNTYHSYSIYVKSRRKKCRTIERKFFYNRENFIAFLSYGFDLNGRAGFGHEFTSEKISIYFYCYGHEILGKIYHCDMHFPGMRLR